MKRGKVTETRGPLVVGGVVMVDPERFPALHRAVSKMVERGRGPWVRVVELRAKGEADAADRAARRAMGVKGEPMTEEAKEKLREYREAHKDEIAARAKLKRVVKARTRQMMKPARRRR